MTACLVLVFTSFLCIVVVSLAILEPLAHIIYGIVKTHNEHESIFTCFIIPRL